MKTRFIIIIVALFFSGKSKVIGQAYPRNANPNYIWTVLEENFTGNGLDRNIWKVSGFIKDDNLYKFVDSPTTVNLNQTYIPIRLREDRYR